MSDASEIIKHLETYADELRKIAQQRGIAPAVSAELREHSRMLTQTAMQVRDGKLSLARAKLTATDAKKRCELAKQRVDALRKWGGAA